MDNSRISRIFCTLDGKSYNVYDVSDVKPTSFPSEWFATHKGEKPSLTVMKNMDLERLRPLMLSSPNNSKVPVLAVVTYIYLVLREQKVTCPADWESYGTKISPAGARISPFDLVTVKEIDPIELDTVPERSVPEGSDKWICIMLLAIYRLERAKEASYESALIRNITALIKGSECSEPPNLTSMLRIHMKWANDPHYKMAVAAVDMFYYRFDQEPWAAIRIATIGSRLKDCSAVQSISQTAAIAGLPRTEDIIYWVGNVAVANEYRKMTSTNEEAGMMHSYFPYQVDMGLVTRSAFSARINPALHTWLHVVGIFFRNARSLNAKFFLEKDVAGVIRSAQWVGYVLSRGQHAGRLFMRHYTTEAAMEAEWKESQEEAQEANEGIEEIALDSASETDLTREPVNNDPSEWFTFMGGRDYKLTNGMKHRFRALQKEIVNPRAGTIGAMALTSLFYYE